MYRKFLDIVSKYILCDKIDVILIFLKALQGKIIRQKLLQFTLFKILIHFKQLDIQLKQKHGQMGDINDALAVIKDG